MVVQGGCCEPVSDGIPCSTGNLQGNSTNSGADRAQRTEILSRRQPVSGIFPTRANREFLCTIRDCIQSNREQLLSKQAGGRRFKARTRSHRLLTLPPVTIRASFDLSWTRCTRLVWRPDLSKRAQQIAAEQGLHVLLGPSRPDERLAHAAEIAKPTAFRRIAAR